jgi:hypothetical protein
MAQADVVALPFTADSASGSTCRDQCPARGSSSALEPCHNSESQANTIYQSMSLTQAIERVFDLVKDAEPGLVVPPIHEFAVLRKLLHTALTRNIPLPSDVVHSVVYPNAVVGHDTPTIESSRVCVVEMPTNECVASTSMTPNGGVRVSMEVTPTSKSSAIPLPDIPSRIIPLQPIPMECDEVDRCDPLAVTLNAESVELLATITTKVTSVTPTMTTPAREIIFLPVTHLSQVESGEMRAVYVDLPIEKPPSPAAERLVEVQTPPPKDRLGDKKHVSWSDPVVVSTSVVNTPMADNLVTSSPMASTSTASTSTAGISVEVGPMTRARARAVDEMQAGPSHAWDSTTVDADLVKMQFDLWAEDLDNCPATPQDMLRIQRALEQSGHNYAGALSHNTARIVRFPSATAMNMHEVKFD